MINNATVIEIIREVNFKPLQVQIENIVNSLSEIIRKELVTTNLDLEPQLLHSEFSELKMYDNFGNYYIFNAELIEQKEEDHNIFIYGCVGDSNKVVYTLENYNKSEYVNDSTYNLNYGLVNSLPMSITIVSEYLDSYMQSNKSQNEAIQMNFNEQKAMLQKQLEINNKNVNQTNYENLYNANFSIDMSTLGTISSVTNGAMNLATNIATLNPNFLQQGVNDGIGMISQGRNLQNSYQQRDFVQTRNSMRSEQNSFASMQAKQSLNNSIRMYNASSKDMNNQPSNIHQMGMDLSFQCGNNIDGVYLSYSIPSIDILEKANYYIKMYGVIQNKYYNDITEITKYRKNYNYIKCNTIDIIGLQINATHLNTLKNIFLSGTRIWNYNNSILTNFVNYDIFNSDTE